MNTIGKNLQKCENFIIAICFIVMSLAAFAQVVNRNLIGAPISWFDELARYCMVYLTLLATEAGLRDGSQISVTALLDKCSPTLRRILQIIIKLVIIGFSIMIFLSSFKIIETQLNSGQVSAGLGIPMVVPYLALPITFGMITIVQIIILITLITSPIPTKEENK